MLRISETTTKDRADLSIAARLLCVEGALTRATVPTLCHTCRESLAQTPRLSLDLAGITFIDTHGAKCLQRLRARGVEFYRTTSFIDALMNRLNGERADF